MLHVVSTGINNVDDPKAVGSDPDQLSELGGRGSFACARLVVRLRWVTPDCSLRAIGTCASLQRGDPEQLQNIRPNKLVKFKRSQS